MELPLDELLAIADDFERRMVFVAALQTALRDCGEETVLVGGHAVETYTLGDYTTADVDLVVIVKRPVEQLLERWGFRREGRVFWHERLGLAVDIIGQDLGGSWDRTQLVAVRDYTARVIAPEDLIIDRLNACVHWGLPDHCSWAQRVFVAERDRLDLDYLRRRAREELVTETLEKIMAEVHGGTTEA
ncbi:hypothetical protein LLH23_02245 [bacterium]|nr:hypothetical protein [bacterium]